MKLQPARDKNGMKICTLLQFALAAKNKEVENTVECEYTGHFMTDNNDFSGESQH